MHSLRSTFLAFGSVRVTCFKPSSLIAAMRVATSAEAIGLDDMKKYVRGLSSNEIDKLKPAGCVPVTVVQEANDIVVVPAGWLVAFESKSGVLIYGARASVVLKTAGAYDEYSAMAGCYAVDKLPAHSNMVKAMALMEVLRLRVR